MFKSIIRCFFFFILIASCSSTFAQSKKELQEKKRKLQKEINYTNSLLEKTAKSKNTSLSQLRQLNKKISSRQRLILAMELEIQIYSDSILKQELVLDSLESDLAQLKEEYAKMIRNAYKNRSAYDKMMFLFSAENFNQAYKRLKYFQQYAAYRQSQAENIKLAKEALDGQINLLEAIRASKQGILKSKLNERNILAQEKNKKQTVVNSLKVRNKS